MALVARPGDVPEYFDGPLFLFGSLIGFPLLDGGKGAEHQAADIGEDGGAARGDAILDEQSEEFGEGGVDSGRGLEFIWGESEKFSEVFRTVSELLFEGGVARAEARGRAEVGPATLASCGVAILAARGVVVSFLVHFGTPQWGCTPVFLERSDVKR